MIISIYRTGKEQHEIEVETLDVVKYSIVANKLHYLPLGENWKEVDLTSYKIESLTISKDT